MEDVDVKFKETFPRHTSSIEVRLLSIKRKRGISLDLESGGCQKLSRHFEVANASRVEEKAFITVIWQENITYCFF